MPLLPVLLHMNNGLGDLPINLEGSAKEKVGNQGLSGSQGLQFHAISLRPHTKTVECPCDGETPHIRQKRITGLPLFLFIDIWWLRYIHAPTHSIVCCSTVVGHSMSLCSVSGWRQPVIQGQPKGKPTNLLESSLRYYSIHYRHSKLQVCLTNASRSKCSVLSYCTE